MSDLSNKNFHLSPGQQEIRDKCFHPSGAFVEFPIEDIEASIPERFEKIVRLYPDRLAVKMGDRALTYDELNKAANRIACAILALRGEDEEPIGLLFNKGANLVMVILGTLKAGKHYVLLDSSLPAARSSFILEHSQASLLVTDNEHLSLARGLDWEERQTINVDELSSGVDCKNPRLSISANAIAWTHYTSGSTGQPKGVMQNHRNALHVVRVHTNDYRVCSEDRLTFLASRGGDIFLSLLNGSSVFPVDLKREGLAQLGNLLIQERITIYGSVASTFRHFIASLSGAEQFPNLRLIKLVGEPLYKTDVDAYRKHFSQDCILVNRLGGTETGTFCHYFVDHSTSIDENVLPVGYAVDDKQILLLGDDGKDVGINQIGEIAVKSHYLSPGYWRSPDLTKAAFLPDPEGGDLRTYLIGDLGRRLANGCLIHVGRKDFQVKIRGSRVEIAEVETALLAFDNVKEAVVASHDSSGNTQLVAYIVPKTGTNLTVNEIRRSLAVTLPDYMIPSAFVMMERLPVTGIGKVDRRALPDPGKSRPEMGGAYVAPRSRLEHELATTWAEILNLEQVGAHDNFFDLGGHSLAACRIISRIIKTFELDLPIKALFDSPTVAEMAAIITRNQAKRASDAELAQMLREVEAMSEEEAQQLVAKETAKG